ncbi:hypothetical protein ACRE_071590 [Hapsidospora chrysogenum ATCC 11550]|uniref:VOC domain-containing protein n=1 Tax=Hapsidospora chrysogenum (strain ATCC 11550 / CBS 779.69 / DSM 880 / IAM 14645 / JCM 23072 / IMI 49137) TaxID=857340 RepID=A0A086SYB8_HAPC1|nr:hypothetical protein ACRE_071590 [Hapsidospora chrysogenum ATCC 11550]
MSDWKPPPFGTPVWMAIPATDVGRATDFYKAVFNLAIINKPGREDTSTEIRHFNLNPGLNISGGIIKAPDSTGALSAGRGGVVINWFVEDVDASAELIKKAGGKVISEKEKESDFGLYRYFEDTEGNVGAVYMMVKK